MFSGLCVCGVRMNVETKVNTSSVFSLLPSLALHARSASCAASFQTNALLICWVFPGVQSPFKVCGFEKNKIRPKGFFLKT